MKKITALGFLRTVALAVLLTGAVGSLSLMFNTGRNQKSFLLIVLFTIWVLSPFIAFLVADVIPKRWSVLSRVTLYFLMLFITLGSLVSYSGALSPMGTKPAFVFLVVPFISWLFMALVIFIAWLLSRRKNKA